MSMAVSSNGAVGSGGGGCGGGGGGGSVAAAAGNELTSTPLPTLVQELREEEGEGGEPGPPSSG
jgi:hypothetical protein